MRLSIIRFLLLLTTVAFITGCGAKGGLDLPTGTVSGTVTQGGKPVSDSTITFFGEDFGDTATGVIQEDGTYTLKYQGGFSIPVGDYRVAITPGGSSSNQPPQDPADLMKTVQVTAPQKNKVPNKYATPDSSGLIAVIKEGSNSSVDFDLK